MQKKFLRFPTKKILHGFPVPIGRHGELFLYSYEVLASKTTSKKEF